MIKNNNNKYHITSLSGRKKAAPQLQSIMICILHELLIYLLLLLLSHWAIEPHAHAIRTIYALRLFSDVRISSYIRMLLHSSSELCISLAFIVWWIAKNLLFPLCFFFLSNFFSFLNAIVRLPIPYRHSIVVFSLRYV